MTTNSNSGSEQSNAATLADVAREAGVSRAAVSKVIRNAYGVSAEMRERVELAIKKLDYRPRVAARAMRGSSFTIGFEIPQLGNELFTKVLEGATAGLAGTGYQLIIAPTDDARAAHALESLSDRQVDGIIAITPFVSQEWLEKLAKRIPIVMLGRHDMSAHYDTVVGDDVAGARLAMNHLFELGHRRIAHITREEAVTQPDSGTPPALRLETYLRMMAERDFEPHVVRSGAYEHDAYVTAKELMADARTPTAIFVTNDQLAIGVLQAINEAGLAPSDVSVVGYDDIRIAAHPAISLTTVDQFGVELGRRAVEILLSRIKGRAEPIRFLSAPELRVRHSTAPLPSWPCR